MKKEELIKKVGILESEVWEFKNSDDSHRKTISIILGKFSKGAYNNSEVLSWLEISAEIGKLIAGNILIGLYEDVSKIKADQQILWDEIKKEQK